MFEPSLSLPTIPVYLPLWSMVAVGLLTLVAAGLAGSVWVSARKAHVSGPQVLSFFQAMLWVVPAVVVVALVGLSTRPAGPVLEEPAVVAAEPDLLRSRTTSSEAPTWARPNQDRPRDGAVARFVRRVKGQPAIENALVFSSDPFVTEAEASRALTPKVRAAVQDQLREGFPVDGDFTVPVRLIEQHGVQEAVLESFEKDLGIGPEKLVRLHFAVQISPELRDAVYRDWKGQVVLDRLAKYGGGVGMATALMALVAGYLGLNSMTQGRYLWRLRLAAASGLSAAGLLGLLLML